MQYLFVDFENVPRITIEDDSDIFEKIYIFVGRSQNKLDFELVQRLQGLGARVDWIKIGGEGKNNLDFHLSYMLGRMDAETGKEIGFIILSRDKGYDALIRHISESGRECRRVDSIGKQAAAQSRPSRSSSASSSGSSSGSSSRPSARRRGRRGGRVPLQDAGRDRPVPYPGKGRGGSRAAPAATVPISETAGETRVLAALGRLRTDQRPSTKKSILNYLENQHGAGKKLPPPQDLLEALMRTGKIFFEGSKIKYRL